MGNLLVLKNGRISEELEGEEGVYPQLGLLNGYLVAGNTGLLTIKVIAGYLTQIAVSPGGVLWDTQGPSIWDAGAASWGTNWDVLVEAVWDAGASAWS